MKSANVAALAGVLIQTPPTQGSPIGSVLSGRAGIGAAKVVGFILDLIGIAGIEPEPVYLWDFKEHPEMCQVFMTTEHGGNCKVSVECNEKNGGFKEYTKFSACRVGGESKLEDPRIGPFSINFSERDGEGQGQGLTTPILKVAYVDNWAPIPVNSECKRHRTDDAAGKPDQYLCHYGNYPNGLLGNHISNNPLKKWACGVPRTGLQAVPGGPDSNGPENKKGYRPGTCSVHVKQFQKPDPRKDDYALEISSVRDANGKKIGGQGKAGKHVDLKTNLPNELIFRTGGVDADPVKFRYGKDEWTSNDQDRCSVGKYDSGDRDMDCTFKCD